MQARAYAKAMKATLFFSSATHNINVNKIFKFIMAKLFNLPWTVERNLTIGEPIIDFQNKDLILLLFSFSIFFTLVYKLIYPFVHIVYERKAQGNELFLFYFLRSSQTHMLTKWVPHYHMAVLEWNQVALLLYVYIYYKWLEKCGPPRKFQSLIEECFWFALTLKNVFCFRVSLLILQLLKVGEMAFLIKVVFKGDYQHVIKAILFANSHPHQQCIATHDMHKKSLLILYQLSQFTVGFKKMQFIKC